MARRPRLSAKQLHERFTEPSDLARLTELLDLREYLRHCLIRSDYAISDSLNAAIVLSEYGDWLQREVGRKKIPVKEGRLLCFLEFYHRDLLIDHVKMDPEKLADAIGDELIKGKIQLPFAHGPDLYRRAAELFPDEKTRLGTSDAARLLEDSPIGVFHLGRWISGPYGMIESRERRLLGPSLNVPLQHCHDVACQRVHRVLLETDQSAPINEHRSAARKALESEGSEPSDFSIFFGDVLRDDTRTYNDFDLGTLPLVLGDCLSETEIRSLLLRLISQDSSLRTALTGHGLTGDAVQFLSTLNRAQLLQLSLVANDSALMAALDYLVISGEIVVPPGEIRASKLYPGATAGAFGSRVELAQYGVRVDARSDIAPLRLRRILNEIYGSDDVHEAEELAWQLREVAGVTISAQLDEYLRTASPRDVVSSLVLGRRRHTEIAAKGLGLDLEAASSAAAADLVDRILWKLGFGVSDPERLHDRFWQLHEELAQSARSAAVSTTVNEEGMRGLSANYFEQLEMVLADSLAFASWVLTHDHVMAERPFHYDDEASRAAGIATVQDSSSNADGPEKLPLEFGDKATLYALCRGFAILAHHLRTLKCSAVEHERPKEQYPRFAENTGLKKFPFCHSVPFLDLIPSSQARILEALEEVSRLLVAAKVSEVRNAQIHYRRAASDLRPLIEGLEATRAAIRSLEDLGFIRVLFTASRVESDQWLRTTAYLTDHSGREVVVGRPSEFTWLNLPDLAQSQYLVVSAQFAEPNEILRVTLGVPSEFTKMWSGFPSRRADSGYARRATSGRTDPVTPTNALETSAT